MVAQAERGVLHLDVQLAARLGGTHRQQLLGVDRVPAQLIERTQQPRAGEVRAAALGVPHLHGAADELVATGALHAVDAQVRAADAHRVLRRPGARRVVLRGHQPVTRVERRRHRRAEVHVAEAEHEVAGVEHDAVHVVDAVESVHPADELDVPRAPRRVGAHAVHVPLDGLARRRVVPRQRQVDDARGERLVDHVRQLGLRCAQRVERPFHREPVAVHLDEQRADAGRGVDHTVAEVLAHPLVEGVHAQPEVEVERHRTVLDEQEAIAGAPVGHRRRVVGRSR